MNITNKKVLMGLTGIITGSLLLTSGAFATELPSHITFSNFTPLALNSSLAGLPGQGIAPNVTRPVFYSLVHYICSFTSNLNNCPIEFTNRENGEKVATVYLNAETATLTQAPIFHGNYGDEYEVVGWNASPLCEITITKKA